MSRLNEIIEFLSGKLAELDPADMAPCAGLRLNALKQIYDKTGDETAKKLIIQCADKILESETIVTVRSEEMEYTSPLCVLFAAYSITGDEKYKEKIVKLEKNSKSVKGDVANANVYTGLVFDMMYESKFGGKERYYAVTKAICDLNKREFPDDLSKALYFEVLVDSIEAIDQPMYELYRNLVDTFRDEIHKIGGSLRPFEDPKANLVYAYAVKKACSMKVILAEKYEAFADEIIAGWDKVNCPFCLAFSQTL